jgi:arsenite/tail-anchored protein-transporting ATPase
VRRGLPTRAAPASRCASTGTDSAASALARAVGDARFVFVVGKGGTGKTTAAGALALELADGGSATHLISTDPAHSIADLFAVASADGPSPCTEALTLEAFDANAWADRWLGRVTAPVAELIERGSYLDAEDVAGLTRLALPGVDELMAALRLADLADDGRRIVVDTAPTGHTLRLLDAGAAHDAFARALRALADKAATVATSLTGRSVRLAGEAVIEELEGCVRTWNERVLRPAAFVIAAREHVVVAAETRRLATSLRGRGLRVAATVHAGGGAVEPSLPQPVFVVPLLDEVTGCDGLRRWRRALRPAASAGEADARPPTPEMVVAGEAAGDWLRRAPARLLVFAGKGGVGKTTCAAAAALVLAGDREVTLCSADPAGSLDDVFGGDAAGLRVVQVDAEARLDWLREEARHELVGAFESVGLAGGATLDRRVIDALWDLAPPGIDEFAALAEILDATASHHTVVLDTAPTGHFLRLLGTPRVALDWVRQLMRIVVKYHATSSAPGVAEALLQAARELRALDELLHDATRCGVIVVTLDEPLVRAETGRLLDALHATDVAVSALLLNRSRNATDCDADTPLIRAPLRVPPPVGAAALRDFAASWKIEA